MAQICLLDSETIDRIAAGEVVERPSSVVKELIENAIDAGASAITVEIRAGGKELIRVTDNGCGIEASMVARAFERHSTSKLRRIEDLQTIQTLGFRGEALSSIAAVSKVELMTKTADAMTGTWYRVEGGVEKGMQHIGLPQGTTILVKDLFYHVPARLKFLKTDQTETSYVTSLIEEMALSHPETAIKYTADGKIRLQTAGSGNEKDVIYRIYGNRITQNLIGIDVSDDTFRVSGFLGQPSLSRGNRRYESVFVNGRCVTDRILQKGIEDGYKRYLMQHQFPFAVLFFETDGHLVDVNVHPAKAQVRFREEKRVYDFIRTAVSDTLQAHELIESLPLEKKEGSDRIFSRGSFAAGMEEQRPLVRESAEPYEVNRSQAEDGNPADRSSSAADDASGQIQDPAYSAPGSAGETARQEGATLRAAISEKQETKESAQQLSLPIDPVHRARFRLIGSVFDTYWLLEYDGKLYMIDQHAAHERVNYEKFLRLLRTSKPSSQQLYPAIPVTLQAREMELAERYRDMIRAYGFEIDHFGANEYRIVAVPTQTYGMNAEVFFLSFLDEMNDLSTGTIDPDTITDRLATAACKASIKGHDVISDQEALRLLEELFRCEDPYHCPHGRPTLVSLTKSEIEKMFRRIVS